MPEDVPSDHQHSQKESRRTKGPWEAGKGPLTPPDDSDYAKDNDGAFTQEERPYREKLWIYTAAERNGKHDDQPTFIRHYEQIRN